MIFTSNFKIAGHLPQAVAISLGVPRGWRGRRYTRLAPPRDLIKIMEPERFIPLYRAQVLDKLDPMKVIRDLGGDNFIMLLLGSSRRVLPPPGGGRLAAKAYRRAGGGVYPQP